MQSISAFVLFFLFAEKNVIAFKSCLDLYCHALITLQNSGKFNVFKGAFAVSLCRGGK